MTRELYWVAGSQIFLYTAKIKKQKQIIYTDLKG